MYSRIKIEDSNSTALALMCTLPEYQKTGIGLIGKLKYLKEMKEKSIIVLGHTAFYSRLGFKKAAEYGKEFLI